MKVVILSGNMRINSNTQELVQPFIQELTALGASVVEYQLKDLQINPCVACWTCQNTIDRPGCPQIDDMGAIMETVLASDLIVFATPIYAWYCTPPLKAAMDRLVYAMNKYYGDIAETNLWAGKKLALIVTCGYEIEEGAGVYEEGIRRFAKHSRLNYLGKFAVRDIDGKVYFTNDEVQARLKAFTKRLFCATLANK